MHRQYKSICSTYGCDVKVYTQAQHNLEYTIGQPDLIVLFTNPVSHKVAKSAREKAARDDIALVQSHSGSGSALKTILANAKGCA